MSVPEAAMDKDDRVIAGKHDIRTPKQALSTQPVAEAAGVESFPHQYFQLRVAAANP